MKLKQLLIAIAVFLSAVFVLPIPPVFAPPTINAQNGSNNCNATSASSFTCTLSVTAGHTLVLTSSFLKGGSGISTPSFTPSDSQGNTFVSIVTKTSNTCSGSTDFCGTWSYYVASAASTGTDTFTFTWGTTGTINGNLWDISGVSTSGIASSTGNGQSTQTYVVASYTLNALTIAAYTSDGDTGTRTAGTSFTLVTGQPNFPSAGNQMVGESSTTASGSSTCSITTTVGQADVGLCVSFAAAAVTVNQNIKITTFNSAPSATISISGCGVSNGTFTANGNIKHYTGLTNSCTVTLTEPADGANTRYRWNVSPHPTAATSITFATCASGTCTEYDNTTYYQLQNTYAMNPTNPTTWDASYSKAITGTFLATSSTICTDSLANGGGSASCTNWADYNTLVTLPPNFPSTASAGPNWVAQNANTFTDTTGGNTHTTNYALSASVTFQITAKAQTLFDAGMTLAITGTFNGSPATLCTITTGAVSTNSCAGFPDFGTTATFASTLTGAPAGSRWENQQGGAYTTGGIVASTTINVNYYKQWTQAYSYLWNCTTGAVCTPGAPILSYTALGASATVTEGTSSANVFIDANSVASVTPTLTDNLHNIYTTSPTSWTITAANLVGNPSIYNLGSVGIGVVGWNFPSGTTYANALLPMIAPLIGGAIFVSFMYMFHKKGDLVVTLWLLGTLLGTAFFALNNGTTLTSDLIPFAMLVIEAFQFVAWIWISGVGGNPQGQQQL